MNIRAYIARLIGRPYVMETQCSVLQIRASEGMSEIGLKAIARLLDAVEPDHQEFLSPGTVTVYFVGTEIARLKAVQLEMAVTKVFDANDKYPTIAVGVSHGPVFVAYDGAGKTVGSPLGSTVLEASNAALRKQENELAT